jgi:hypothetical protein
LLTITQLGKDQQLVLPYLRSLVQGSLEAYLFVSVITTMRTLFDLNEFPIIAEPYTLDYNQIAQLPQVTEFLRRRDLERNAWNIPKYFYISNAGGCRLPEGATMLGVKPEKAFSPVPSFAAQIGDWIAEPLQELMKKVSGLLLENSVELSLRGSGIENKTLMDVYNLTGRCDFILADMTMGDVKSYSKKRMNLIKYAMQISEEAHLTGCWRGLILGCDRDTFELNEWEVTVGDDTDLAWWKKEGDYLVDSKFKVLGKKYPTSKPGKGCEFCPANIREICPEPDEVKSIYDWKRR